MTVLGYILVGLGCIVWIAGEVRFMVITYQHGLAWFFTCLFLPIVSWVFFLMYFREAWRPVLVSVVGFVVAVAGYNLGNFDSHP